MPAVIAFSARDFRVLNNWNWSVVLGALNIVFLSQTHDMTPWKFMLNENKNLDFFLKQFFFLFSGKLHSLAELQSCFFYWLWTNDTIKQVTINKKSGNYKVSNRSMYDRHVIGLNIIHMDDVNV